MSTNVYAPVLLFVFVAMIVLPVALCVWSAIHGHLQKGAPKTMEARTREAFTLWTVEQTAGGFGCIYNPRDAIVAFVAEKRKGEIAARNEPRMISQVREQLYVLCCVVPQTEANRDTDLFNEGARWKALLDAYDRSAPEAKAAYANREKTEAMTQV